MASDLKLFLREDLIKTDSIVLESDGYEATPREDFEELVRTEDDSDLMISIHRDTGLPLIIIVEEFVTGTESAIQNLREHPLPWTFSVPQLGIREKPLEDVLLAVWKKYRNVKMIGE